MSSPPLNPAVPVHQVRGSKRLLAAFAACNVSMVPAIFWVDVGHAVLALMATFFGVLLGQLGSLALWTVWAPGALWRRHAANVLCGAVMMAAVWLGQVATTSYAGEWPYLSFYETLTFAALTILAVPPASLAIQAPLWLCRLLFGWRIVAPVEGWREQPLSIRALFVGTAAVAVGLGCLRLHIEILAWFDETDEFVADYWSTWGIGLVVLAALSTLLLVPLVAIVLRPRALRTSAMALGTFTVGATAVGWIAVLATGSLTGLAPVDLHDFVQLSGLIVAFLATLAIPLLMAHYQGFRLHIGRRSPSPPPPLSHHS